MENSKVKTVRAALRETFETETSALIAGGYKMLSGGYFQGETVRSGCWWAVMVKEESAA